MFSIKWRLKTEEGFIGLFPSLTDASISAKYLCPLGSWITIIEIEEPRIAETCEFQIDDHSLSGFMSQGDSIDEPFYNEAIKDSLYNEIQFAINRQLGIDD